MSDSILQILHLFSHESDLRVAVEKNQNALPQRATSAQRFSAFAAPNERRRLQSTHFKGVTATSHLRRCIATLAHVRIVRARRDAPNKQRSLLKRRVRIHDRHLHGVTRQTSDGDFEARVFNATRCLWTSYEASQPSRVFESPRARRVARDKCALVARRKRTGKQAKNDLTVHAKKCTRHLLR